MATSVVSLISNPVGLTDRLDDVSPIQPSVAIAELTRTQPVRKKFFQKHFQFSTGRKSYSFAVTADTSPLPTWLPETLSSGIELLFLPRNWDDEDSPPVDLSTLTTAIQSLTLFMDTGSSPPHVTPTRDGGVQFDWHKNGLDLEIEFAPGASDGMLLFSDRTGQIADWDGAISENLGQLQSLFTTRLHAGSQR